MFKELRRGSLVYILNTIDKPVFKVGTVESVSEPYFPQQMPGQFPYQMNQYVNIVVNVDGNNQNYERLPVGQSITTNGTLTISCNQEALSNEVKNMIRSSTDIVNSVDKHKSIINECDDILKQLNPAYAQSVEQETKIKRLEQEISEMRNMLGGSMDEIKRMISESKNNNVKQTNSK